jgi:hypothetical protein
MHVTARTKCYSIEGSFVDCTIEDTKLKKEEEKEGERVVLLYTQAIYPLLA